MKVKPAKANVHSIDQRQQLLGSLGFPTLHRIQELGHIAHVMKSMSPTTGMRKFPETRVSPLWYKYQDGAGA